MKFNPNSFICCRNLWTHVDGLRSLGGLEGSLDQHMLMCWTWTRWFLLCFPRWQRISYFHSFTCAHSPVWLMTLWRCCPCALERSVFSEFDPQRNTNEKSEFNKPALCYSSLYLMLLTLNSVPINSEMEMVRVQSALNMFTRSQIHMKSTGGVGSLDMDSALHSLQLFIDCLDVTAKIWHIKHNSIFKYLLLFLMTSIF